MGLVKAVLVAFRQIWEALRFWWRAAGGGRNAKAHARDELVDRPGVLPVVEPDGDVVEVPYAALRHDDLIDEAGEVRVELLGWI